ncbi:MAG TPA: Ig-like domain-containing protein [Solirubrobacteraceae bacterium]
MWTDIAEAPAQIYDADGTRLLYRHSNTQLAIRDLATGETTVIPAPDPPEENERILGGLLSPHGALVFTDYTYTTHGNPSRIHEWRDGTLIEVAHAVSGREVLKAGDLAIWYDDGEVHLRDLDAGTSTFFGAPKGRPWIADNGDAVWEDSGIWRRRGSDGAIAEIADAPGEAERSPVTDGINTVWALEQTATNGLKGIGPDGAPLDDFAVGSGSSSLAGSFALDGGWIAYSRRDATGGFHYSLWRRPPGGDAGDDVRVTPDDDSMNTIVALNGEGELMYIESPDSLYFAAPGEPSVRAGRRGPGFYPFEWWQGAGDRLFSVDGRWYYIRGTVLRRFQEGAAAVPGSQTTIDSGPPDVVESPTAPAFTFSSPVDGASFECKLDGGGWEPCASPKSYPAFADGLHTFLARAVLPGGDVDPEPASQAFWVDTAAPVVSLWAPEDGSAKHNTSPALGGQGGGGAGDGEVIAEVWEGTAASGTPIRTFTRSAAGGEWQVIAVDPPLAEGVYTARARQTDVAGHQSQSTANTFTIDVTPPPAFALRAPAPGTIVGPRPVFSWDEPTDSLSGIDRMQVGTNSIFGSYSDTATCADGVCSTQLVNALPEGPFTWYVSAWDRASNSFTTPARAITVDATPPAPFALSGPADGSRTTDTTPTLSWAATTDAVAGMGTYDVFVDGARVATGLTGTDVTTAALGDGPHAWRVEAIDAVGNVRASATRTVVVDTTAPVAALAAAPNPVLAGDDVVLDAGGSTDAFAGPIAKYEWDADGDGSFEADTGGSPTLTTSFVTGEHTPGVRITDVVGHTATASTAVSARPVPLPGFAGVSINGGDRFTNDPDVTVNVIWPPLANGLVLSNDGGFGDAVTFALGGEIPWTLDSSGAERLPRTIYARFLGLAGGRETYQDDIILDETDPQLLRATAERRSRRRVVVSVRARDNLSGVEAVQVAKRKAQPGPARAFARRLTLLSRSTRLYVRVRDGAGNWSRWKRAIPH